MSDEPHISARTRAEMAAGAKNVAAAQAWATADRCEKEFRTRFPRTQGEITILAVFGEGKDVWMLETKVWPSKADLSQCVVFPREDYGVFPSETLQTQIMLLLG